MCAKMKFKNLKKKYLNVKRCFMTEMGKGFNTI